MKCEYGLAWIGSCGVDDCTKHADIKCSSCGAPATHECDATFGLVCGSPLCDDCTHELTPEGVNVSDLKHCKKTEQKHKPWYAQETTA